MEISVSVASLPRVGIPLQQRALVHRAREWLIALSEETGTSEAEWGYWDRGQTRGAGEAR